MVDAILTAFVVFILAVLVIIAVVVPAYCLCFIISRTIKGGIQLLKHLQREKKKK